MQSGAAMQERQLLRDLPEALGALEFALAQQRIDPLVDPRHGALAAHALDRDRFGPSLLLRRQKSSFRRSISAAIASNRGSPLSHVVNDHSVMSSWSVQVARASGVSGGCESVIEAAYPCATARAILVYTPTLTY